MKNGFNMLVHGSPLGLLHSFGSKLMDLIKSNKKLKNLNDSKGKKKQPSVKHNANRAAKGNC